MDLRSILSEKQWILHRPNGDVRSPAVRFEANGRIAGYSHINETLWDMEGHRLVFRHAEGHVTARSGDILLENGSHAIFMMKGDDPATRAHFLVERQIPFADFATCRSLSEILVLTRMHRALGEDCFLGTPGFTPPAIDELEII